MVKNIAQPLLGQPPRQLESHNPLAKTQDLGIVAQHSPLDREAIVGRHSAHALDLVRGDGNSQSRSTYQHGSIDGPVCDKLRCGGGAEGVCCLVVAAVAADVFDEFDTLVFLEVGFDGVLVANTGFLGKRDRLASLRTTAKKNQLHRSLLRFSI